MLPTLHQESLVVGNPHDGADATCSCCSDRFMHLGICDMSEHWIARFSAEALVGVPIYGTDTSHHVMQVQYSLKILDADRTLHFDSPAGSLCLTETRRNKIDLRDVSLYSPSMLPCSQSTMIQSTPVLASIRETLLPGIICQQPILGPFAPLKTLCRRFASCILVAILLAALLQLLAGEGFDSNLKLWTTGGILARCEDRETV